MQGAKTVRDLEGLARQQSLLSGRPMVFTHDKQADLGAIADHEDLEDLLSRYHASGVVSPLADAPLGEPEGEAGSGRGGGPDRPLTRQPVHEHLRARVLARVRVPHVHSWHQPAPPVVAVVGGTDVHPPGRSRYGMDAQPRGLRHGGGRSDHGPHGRSGVP